MGNVACDHASHLAAERVHEAPAQTADRVTSAVAGFIRGKAEVIDLAVTCLLAEGHLLLDDVPGVGKTSLARALSHCRRRAAGTASSSPPTCCRPT